MLLLQMRRTKISGKDSKEKFSNLFLSLPDDFRPLISPTLTSQAAALGLPVENLRKAQDSLDAYSLGLVGRRQDLLFGEVFTDGASLFIVCIRDPSREAEILTSQITLELAEGKGASDILLYVYYVGGEVNSNRLQTLESVVNNVFGVTLQPSYYTSSRFSTLRDEGRMAPASLSEGELAAARTLADRATRTLAVAIKASGGLLVRDLQKQLPPDARDKTEQIQKDLQEANLIDAEIVVVCSKTQAQTARVPSREVLGELSKQGLKCACGRPIAEERVEEALTITDRGRGMLDGSRWLTTLLLEELHAVGIPLDKTLVEHHAGGDELDVLADISGELVFFELKDKEFNLGSAYSFGAKIGIIRPEYPVIVTTEYVGNDAKEHFQRARLARTPRSQSKGPEAFAVLSRGEQSNEILYIEGVSNLQRGIRELVSAIYSRDAGRLLNEILQLGFLDGMSIVRSIDDRLSQQITDTQG